MAAIPGQEPLNLLALDGGGIRGVSELVILHEIMLRVQQRGELQELPRPCDYFHLVGGTSTGGLVAIMLGRLRMSTLDALKAYDQFAGRIFSEKNRKKNPGQRWTQMYKATELRNTIQQLVAEQIDEELMRDSRKLEERGRSFVCSKPVGEHRRTVRFRSYDIDNDLYKHLKIWEAARATTAAPMYFKPMTITNDVAETEDFVDGAIGCNNPTEILLEEADLLYGKQRKLGCVVSLGTGTKVQELAGTSNGIHAKASWIKSLGMVMKEITVDCEETHDRAKKKFESFSGAYFRFNVAGGAQGIKLEDWGMMEELKQKTRNYLLEDEAKAMVDDLANVLLQKGPNHGLTIGHIGGLQRDNLLLHTQAAIPRGHASRIFTGRETILRKLERHFGKREAACDSRREFHLRGLGGVGKTQIALKFADQNDKRFRVIWIDATNPLTIEQSYKKYARRLFPGQDPDLAVQLVLQWLEDTDAEWLLVFDNASENGLSQYMPDGDRGNIIYTSRHHHLERRLRPDSIQDVDCLEAGDAITLLLRAGDIDAREMEARRIGRAIVDELGCLPLAIDQAGAYIQMAPCPLNKFLEVYNKEKEQLLKNPPFRGEDELRNLPVYTTFNISFEFIRAYSERRRDMDKVQHASSAIQILSIICFYHNEGLIREIFSCAADQRAGRAKRNEHFPLMVENRCLNELVEMKDGIWDSRKFDQGIKFLRDFSLVKFDDDTEYTAMHVLVHEWARGRLDRNLWAQYGLVARSILFDSISHKDTMSYALYRRDTLPHIEACQKYYKCRHEDDILESEYDSKYALVQKEACNFKEAEAALKRAIRVRQFEYSFLSEATLAAMTQLGDVYTKQGRYGEAEAVLVEALTRRQMALLEKKGALYGRTRKPKGWEYPGEPKVQQIQPDHFQTKGKEPEHPVGRDAPVDHVQKPQKDAELEDPVDDPDILDYKIRLARVYAKQDQMWIAKEQVKDVVRAYKRKYGATSNNSTLRSAISYLRSIEQMTTGVFEHTASIQAREALDASIRLRGRTAPWTMSLKGRLAIALATEHQFKEAEDLYAELFYYYRKHFGETALETIDLISNVGRMYGDAGRWMEAEGLHQVALNTREKKLGRNHPDTLRSMQDLAFSIGRQARVDEALPLMKECAERQAAILGADHTSTKLSQYLVKRLLRLQPACTPAIQTLMRNIHTEKLRSTVGEFAPQWTREWQPEPVVVPDAEMLFWYQSLRATETKIVLVQGKLELRSIRDEVL